MGLDERLDSGTLYVKDNNNYYYYKRYCTCSYSGLNLVITVTILLFDITNFLY